MLWNQNFIDIYFHFQTKAGGLTSMSGYFFFLENDSRKRLMSPIKRQAKDHVKKSCVRPCTIEEDDVLGVCPLENQGLFIFRIISHSM